ncbi:hypothetical protein BDZ97DRAFT_1876229 [Flammula alnicola]|nr:hypothetical protein BDZ97DRAFT_1876229 [Flammula alnicola]
MLQGNGKKHRPRHDLESFSYILLWICWNYTGPSNVERQNFDITREPGLREWLLGDDFEIVADLKASQMSNTGFLFERGTL